MIAVLLLALAPHVVATEALPKGTVLTAGMVEARGGADLSRYLGLELSRPVFAGRPIAASHVRLPDAVERQSAVTVRFSRGPLVLTLPGRALTAGPVGDTVTVLMDGKRRPVRAVVAAPGIVEIGR